MSELRWSYLGCFWLDSPAWNQTWSKTIVFDSVGHFCPGGQQYSKIIVFGCFWKDFWPGGQKCSKIDNFANAGQISCPGSRKYAETIVFGHLGIPFPAREPQMLPNYCFRSLWYTIQIPQPGSQKCSRNERVGFTLRRFLGRKAQMLQNHRFCGIWINFKARS